MYSAPFVIKIRQTANSDKLNLVQVPENNVLEYAMRVSVTNREYLWNRVPSTTDSNVLGTEYRVLGKYTRIHF